MSTLRTRVEQFHDVALSKLLFHRKVPDLRVADFVIRVYAVDVVNRVWGRGGESILEREELTRRCNEHA